MSDVKPWPEIPTVTVEYDKWSVTDDYDREWLAYEHVRAEAWESRCRVAVAKLQAIESLKIVNRIDANGQEFPGSWHEYSIWKSELAKEALAAIGPLPEEPPATPGEVG